VKLRWSETAAKDLEAIYDFIALDKPGAAAITVETIFQTAGRLEQYPNLGHIGRRKGSRELVHPPFVIVYRAKDDVIDIQAILHGNRRYE
jgi:plasmid stabilization system protein ParE